jgi:3-deoxy-D-manno-octulosonic-acid transferase
MTRFDLAYYALAPIMVPLYLAKLWKARRPIAPLWDRLGGPFLDAGEKPRIWVHAVSVGEALGARTLVKELENKLGADYEVVVSASTETGRDVAARTYGNANVFPCPLDVSGSVKKAFDSVKPALIVLMELEIWPNMIAEAERRGVPVAVVNGRVTDRSARGYARFGALLRGTMKRVSLFAVQTQVYAERFRAIGAPRENIQVTGSMKYDGVAADAVTRAEREKMRRSLGLPPEALVLVGGSTHPSEELILLRAARALLADFPQLRVVLVPRHTNRVEVLVPEIEQVGWKVRRRSKMSKTAALMRETLGGGEALLVDTMGELGDVYRAADVAFIGGSFIPHGGQNMMEPAALGIPVLYGPHTGNFTETVGLLKQSGGGRSLADEDALREALAELFRDEQQRKQMGAAGRKAVLEAQGATARNVELLAGLLRREA